MKKALATAVTFLAVFLPALAIFAEDEPKRTSIQEVEAFAYISENMTISQTRQAAFAEAKRQALERAKTFIRSQTRVKDFEVEYDLVWSDAEGAVTLLESKDEGIKENTRYYVWIKAEVEYSLLPKERQAPPSAASIMPVTMPKEGGDAPTECLLPASGPLSVCVWTDKKTYKPGEYITVFIKGNRDFYAVVADENPAGEIIRLLPNTYRPTGSGPDKGPFKAGVIYTVPGPEDRFRLEVVPPYGEEKITVIASDRPLGSLDLEDAGAGLSRFKGTMEDMSAQTRSIAVTPEPAGGSSWSLSVKPVPAEPSPSGAQFFEASWTITTKD